MSLNEREYFKKKLESLKNTGITKSDLDKLRNKKENRKYKEIKINDSERGLTNYEKTKALRVILESMPGETLEEKRKAFRDNYTNRDLAIFLRKQMYVPTKAGISSRTIRERVAAGIEKMRPVEKDILEELIKNNFNLEENKIKKRVNYRHKVLTLLDYLEAAGIIKKIREDNKKIIGVKVLNSDRLKKTFDTGYVQWPELKPLFKRKQD